ncbi:MAG: hypothetical protein M1826_006071 [Phylliscum demangeonii]|nr:MAG: hypothetical protein M1826_006071 [Phylliscum demangeonii]
MQVSLNDNATSSDLEQAKKDAQAQGGTIKDEFTLIKGFTVEFPDDAVHTFQSNDAITVEKDGEVTTQKAA